MRFHSDFTVLISVRLLKSSQNRRFSRLSLFKNECHITLTCSDYTTLNYTFSQPGIILDPFLFSRKTSSSWDRKFFNRPTDFLWLVTESQNTFFLFLIKKFQALSLVCPDLVASSSGAVETVSEHVLALMQLVFFYVDLWRKQKLWSITFFIVLISFLPNLPQQNSFNLRKKVINLNSYRGLLLIKYNTV